MIDLNEQELRRLSFMVMGDGGLYLVGRCSNAKFIMNMREQNKDYIEWVGRELSKITTVHISDRKDYNTDGCVRSPQVRLYTTVSPVLTEIRDRIYREDGYKGLDKERVDKIDWENLATLYMCDGSANEYLRPEIGMKNPSYRVTLNMKRLNEEDQNYLRAAIKKNLGVNFKMNRQNKYTYLNLPVKDVPYFMEQISPFVFDSFKYKVLNTTRKESST